MHKEELYQELRTIAVRSVFLNLAAYLISVCFIGFTVSMAIGLLVGTALLFADLLLLHRFIQRMVERAGRHAYFHAISSYASRLLLIGIVFWVAVHVSWIHPYATVIPLFYPKLIYVGSAIFQKKEGGGS